HFKRARSAVSTARTAATAIAVRSSMMASKVTPSCPNFLTRLARRQGRPREHRPLAELGQPGLVLLGQLERGGERHFQPAVEALARVLRRVVDLDRRIRAVVLGPEADVAEPERELGLGRGRAVDQRMTRPDADDTAPGAGAYQRTEVHQLEVVREDVAVA